MKVFWRLAGYLRPYRGAFLLCLALVAVASGLELFKPWPLKLAVDQVIGKAPLEIMGRQIDYQTLAVSAQLLIAVGLLLFAHLGVGFVQLLNNYMTIRIGQNMVQDFRRELFEHIQRQSLLFHQQRPTGDLLYRLMGDTYAVQTLLMNGVFTTLTSSVLLAGMLAVLLKVNTTLTIYAMGVVPLLFLTIAKVSKSIGNLSYETSTRESQVYSTAERIFSSIPLIQAFAREDEERKRFLAESQLSFDRKLYLYSLQTAYGWLVGGLTALGTALVIYEGVTQVLSGALTTGELLVFISYLASLYTPVNNLSNTVADIRGSLSKAKRVLEILETHQEVKEAPDAAPLAVKTGEVRFENVSFAYDAGKEVLRDVNLVCPGGAMTAIVGQTGAGKTSLISLLLRFYDPQQGRIVIDGQDLKTLTLKSLRRQSAVVLQETQLFPISVADNIAYGKSGATREEVESAAKLANAHDFIAALPAGYDTVLGEKGANLSGGQRQRISIARALIKDAPLLILDEPTSALDAETESLIMEGLDRLMTGRTTFVIAHRLSMMQRADQIVLIKDQRIAEVGSFDELMNKGGEFARLHALQFGKPRRAAPAAEPASPGAQTLLV
ncbi:MAG: ABC transporter ATP-binding protein [Desulfovibrionaceae bacterium]|nr:ABC transporter ATP-binding protein [Desulfovibrionaceae bacterium]MBF0513531.1 ABC transporter ATP-binding protein [Desulfovibrionaceae bacterium]